MISSPIKYSLYRDSNKIEATRLRSILLFNGKVEKQKRQDLMTKAILSLILQENRQSTRQQILNQLSIQFHVAYREADLDVHIRKLYNAGIIESLNEPFTLIEEEEENDFFQQLELETDCLFEGILKKTENVYGKIHNPDTLKDVIRKALSVYFGMYAYTFFGVQNNKDSDSMRTAAVKVVKDEVSDNRLAESLIIALADVIEHPDSSQKLVLTKWARAFVAMETMSFDPLLNNLRREKLKDKEFIIDTDVALHCLATKSRYSNDYRQMLETIKEIGCTLYLVPDVITEIRKHIDAAVKQARFFGHQLLEFPDDVLYEKLSNVFIDDYVHIAKEDNEPLPFQDYIEEFYDPERPSSQALLLGKLKSIFSEKALYCNLDVDTTSRNFTELNDEVYNLTMLTPKAQNRSDEENKAVSKLDTYLYMAAAKNNEGKDCLSLKKVDSQMLKTNAIQLFKQARSLL